MKLLSLTGLTAFYVHRPLGQVQFTLESMSRKGISFVYLALRSGKGYLPYLRLTHKPNVVHSGTASHTELQRFLKEVLSCQQS